MQYYFLQNKYYLQDNSLYRLRSHMKTGFISVMLTFFINTLPVDDIVIVMRTGCNTAILEVVVIYSPQIVSGVIGGVIFFVYMLLKNLKRGIAS